MADVSISYAGSQIASMDDSGTKTLLTSGKYCESDITVAYAKPQTPEFIKDGKTRIYIDLMEGYTSPYLCFSINGTAVIDWGDGSSTNTVTGTDTASNKGKFTQHIYQNAGKYVITITITGSLYFHGGSYGSYALVTSNTKTNTASTPYRCAIQKLEIGTNANCGANAFRGCAELRSAYVHSPSSEFDSNAFYNCVGLNEIIMPSSSTASFGTYAFYGVMLRELEFWSLTTIPGNIFRNCTRLIRVVVSPTISAISAEAFRNCSSLRELYFQSTTPPAVDNSNAWTDLFSECNIFVPYRDTNSLTEGEVMEAYLSATNYPSSSTYTYIAVATYANNVSLPTETASFFLKWYASKEDAITETNRIYYGNGSEIYARLESTIPSFTYTGTYTIVQDSAMNWRIKFLTSGTFTPANNLNVDIFAVGGGGSCDNLSGVGRRSGGGGGYTQTVTSQALTGGTSYTVTVGYGGGTEGTSASDGGPSSFGSLITANGGKKGAAYNTGGAGGSGGAGCSSSSGTASAVGGSDGSNGETGESANHGGAGQGTTTREFGESSGDLYAGGGGGSPGSWAGGAGGGGAGGTGKTSAGGDGQDGATNTGGGGGACGGKGGSGIVIIRNAR